MYASASFITTFRGIQQTWKTITRINLERLPRPEKKKKSNVSPGDSYKVLKT